MQHHALTYSHGSLFFCQPSHLAPPSGAACCARLSPRFFNTWHSFDKHVLKLHLLIQFVLKNWLYHTLFHFQASSHLSSYCPRAMASSRHTARGAMSVRTALSAEGMAVCTPALEARRQRSAVGHSNSIAFFCIHSSCTAPLQATFIQQGGRQAGRHQPCSSPPPPPPHLQRRP